MAWESSTDIFGRLDWLNKKVKNLLGRVYALETGGGIPGGGVSLSNGSQLREGTIDAGYGGSKGIAQICAAGYELKWEAGRLYVMNNGGTTIREVLYNFTFAPSVNDDISLGFIVGSRWVLDNGDMYVCTDNTLDNAVWTFKAANPYKVYTALLTQVGGDNPNTLTHGDPLTIGVTYRITVNSGDIGDFTNVGAPNNIPGTRFVATGTTPTNWGTAGDVELQYNGAAPTVKVLENTIGYLWFTREADGTYRINSNGLFSSDKTYVSITDNRISGDPTVVLTIIKAQLGNVNTIDINTLQYGIDGGWGGIGNLTDLLLNTPIEIRVYN